MAKDEEQKEIRAQRHDFIKSYYTMATADLDRHLKAGWQTIVVLGGGATILVAGHDGKIGLPIAVSVAIMSAVWGALTVIDANFWAVRAIAFLANVEAVYFSVEDRKAFNIYVGLHPKAKMLESLNYMLWLCIFFAVAAFAAFLYEIHQKFPTLHLIIARIQSIESFGFAFWSMPLIALVGGLWWMLSVCKKRTQDYLDFCVGSPGPGIRMETAELRHVTFEAVASEPKVQIEIDTQASVIDDTKNRLKVFRAVSLLVTILAVGLLVVFSVALGAKIIGRL